MPLPNNFFAGDGLNTAGFSFVAPQRERQYDFTVRVDHNISERQTLFVRYSQGSQNTIGDNVNGGLQVFPVHAQSGRHLPQPEESGRQSPMGADQFHHQRIRHRFQSLRLQLR